MWWKPAVLAVDQLASGDSHGRHCAHRRKRHHGKWLKALCDIVPLFPRMPGFLGEGANIWDTRIPSTFPAGFKPESRGGNSRCVSLVHESRGGNSRCVSLVHVSVPRSRESGRQFTVRVPRSRESGRQFTVRVPRSRTVRVPRSRLESGRQFTVRVPRSRESGRQFTVRVFTRVGAAIHGACPSFMHGACPSFTSPASRGGGDPLGRPRSFMPTRSFTAGTNKSRGTASGWWAARGEGEAMPRPTAM